MNLLYANDRKAAYPDSWYAATANPLPPFAPARGHIAADVCVIGAGYTGLSAALHLAQAGMEVVLIDAHRVGFGASGRNGGQLGSGQRVDQQALDAMLGEDAARRLWDLGEDAKALVRDLILQHGIDCALKDGVAWAATSESSMAELTDYAAFLEKRYGYGQVETFEAQRFGMICPSPTYRGGILDHGAAHLHPLRLAFGLARAAEAAGVQIYEKTAALSVKAGQSPTVLCDTAQIEARHVVLACNGYLGGLSAPVAARVMPINNFIVATEPLGPRAEDVLRRDIAVADDLFVLNYFRLSEDNRLLFGGGESYGYKFPKDLRAVVRKPLRKVFPSLADVTLDYAWGGTLAITRKRVPHFGRPARNLWSASGYSGHGIGNAIQAGHMISQAIQGDASGFDLMAELPTPRFPGGRSLRSPMLALAMTWFAMRDRLGR